MDRPEHFGRSRTDEDRVRIFPDLFFFCLTHRMSSHPCHSYVSRANPRDNTRHVILTTASMRPMDFAAQLNVSLANGWGIVRTVADLCLKMPEGKYVLVKDPNKVRFYLYPFLCGSFRGAGALEETCETSGLPPMLHPATMPILGLLVRSHLMDSSCSRSFDCMPSLSRHSPEKKKRKKARRPRKKGSLDPHVFRRVVVFDSNSQPHRADCTRTPGKCFHSQLQ